MTGGTVYLGGDGPINAAEIDGLGPDFVSKKEDFEKRSA